MSWDFTLDKYIELCNAIRELPCEVMTVAQFLKAGQPRRFILVLRHDIDRALLAALRMAELEASLGIQSTYYARMARSVFRPQVLSSIQKLGHEVGYHYETLSKTRGNYEQAIALFEQELQQFRQVVPVETISMHGSPLFPWDNRDLWQSYDFRAYGLLGETYLSINYQHVYYFTDTGRSWEAERHNVRDRVASRQPAMKIRSTDELKSFLKQHSDNPILINTHPNRWTANVWEWGMSLTVDWIANQAKFVVTHLRKTLVRAK